MNRIETVDTAALETTQQAQAARQAKRQVSGGSGFALEIFRGLATLKLTVALLITSTFMIWVATLQQVEMDIWDVKKAHFPHLLVYIPFYTFFPPAWLPDQRAWLESTTVFSRPVGILLPSGFSLILLMIVNLAAAHSLRFRIQGQGTTLWLGWVVAALGTVLCVAVVFMGQNQDGLQAEPPVPYSSMWYVVLLLLLAGGVGMGVWGWRMPRHRIAERILAGSGAVVMGLVPGLLWYSGSFIDDSGMRILWQIAQCSAASLVLLVGFYFLFKRKAGVVLLHAGLLLLLGNEIWVVLTHVEQRVSGVEGDSIDFAYDIRDVELALIQRQGENDRIVTIPSSKLRESAGNPEQWMMVPGTGLQFRVKQFLQNSKIVGVGAANPATAGIGQSIQAEPIALVSGIGQGEVNMASAYVQFRNSSDQDLGTYLVSQASDFYSGPMFDRPNVIRDGEETLFATLWFTRSYKPYTVKLRDVQSKNYPGTEIPQWYATEFTIEDRETGFVGDQMVWMNNPLRYRNETFYQSGYSKDPQTGIETTTLQLVLNRGWMIPYLSCAMVGIGLLAQFLPAMLGYLEKAQRPKSQAAEAAAGVSVGDERLAVTSNAAGSEWRSGSQWVATLAAILVGLVFVGWGMPKRIAVDDLRLEGVATLPVSYKGRIQPLDSLAQTMLRKSCGLEAARSSEETLMGKRKYPATRWLTGLLFDSSSDVNFEVFRIDNRQVLDAMKLPHRTGFRYSWEEIEAGLPKLTEMDTKARAKAKEDRDGTDKSVLDVASNVAFARMVSNSLSVRDAPRMNLNARLFDAAGTHSTVNLPGVVPGLEAGEPWLAANVARMRGELTRMSADLGSRDAGELAVRLIQEAVVDSLLQDPTFRQQLTEVGGPLMELDEAEQKNFLVRQMMGLSPDQLRETISRTMGMEPERYLPAVFSAVETVAGGKTLVPLSDEQEATLIAWESIGARYRERDQQGLDVAVERYREVLNDNQAAAIPWGKVQTEYRLNGWSPFYLSSVMYLFVSLISMVGFFVKPVSSRRFAWTLLLIAFLIHTIGMVARIYISGRAPVTSIYSSALGIAWGMVLTFLIIEITTRRGVANFIGGVSGFATLLVAYALSLSDDTFAVLQAVLDTQFWLWTHVTIIALGYVLTLVAGLWAILMIIYCWLPRTTHKEVKVMADITYGLICGATLLSFIGTVLGGLWADDSWGRFWGWDPKENGAAMIVLWNAAILHARWAGLIRIQGLAAMAIFGNIVTAWSWFAVNELGIGLHSYGFTEGVVFFLTLFWVSQLVFMGFALIPPLNRVATYGRP